MNKNILIVTPFFPPQTHAAVFRAFKLVKYLKRAGWNPVVLTVNRNYLYLEDPDLLDEVSNVPIYRANYIEPTLRGFRMLLGGKDTTLKNITAQRQASNMFGTVSQTKRHNTLWRSIYNYVLARWIQVPDRFVFWKRNAVNLGCQIIKKHNISIVYTTCLPFTCNEIGIALKRKTGIKWVADFRDPITYAKRMYSDYLSVFMKQKKIEQDTFKYADAITGLSGAYLSIFNDFYEGKYSYKTHFIPTGVDDDYLPSLDRDSYEKENSIVFVGEYLPEYKDYFLRIFSEAVHSNTLRDKTCILKIVGNKTINYNRIKNYIEELDLDKNIQFIEHVPQKELYKMIVKSRAAVLIPGYDALWWTNFAKMVDYIALQVPVLAMVPMVSEARAELLKAKVGIFIDNYNQGIRVIENIFNQNVRILPDKNYCDNYLASQQVNSFINIFLNCN